MRITIPSKQVTKVCDHGYVSLYRRKLNQSPLYWVTYKGVTIHLGKRKSMVRKFNHYRGAIGKTLTMKA